MNITMKTILPIITVGTLALSACKNTNNNNNNDDFGISPEEYVNNKASEYVSKYNKSENDYLEITKETNPSLKQAKLDSLAFRDIFNSSSAAKDSEKIAQFNDIARSMQYTFNEIDRILVDEGISPKEYDFYSFKLDKDTVDTNTKFQFFADNWMYRNFFKKIGIMNDSIKKACDNVVKIIKP